MHYSRLFMIAMGFSALFAMPSQALTITTIYRAPGETLTGFGDAEAAPPAYMMYGDGELQHIVETAAAYWETAILDPFDLTIEYGWFPRSTAIATHLLTSQGTTPHRELTGSIAFDNDTTNWYLDSTPHDHSEYGTFTQSTSDLGGGTMVIGRVYENASFPASFAHDLFTVAVHEIGHALGLSGANTAFVAESADGDVDIQLPLDFAGSVIPMNSAHIDLQSTLLYQAVPADIRRLITDADILAIAQVSQFTQINLNPYIVPEPASAALLLMGLSLCLSRRGRRSVA